MVMTTEDGPSSDEMALANEYLSGVNLTKENIVAIKAARLKMIEFNGLLAGVYGVHPEFDPVQWPAPLGKMPHKPPT